ncbi:MAG: APC family permease [Anaerolineae bacterium]
MLSYIKRILIGMPLPTYRISHERLGKVQALAVLSSDALSSVAYATEEILMVLVLAGSAALNLSWPIALAIAALLVIVGMSYFQTVHAYPNGAGSYIVSRENLGTAPSLVAGAALLTDYILTVAVSISAGIAAITSAFPSLYPWRVELAVGAIAFITIMNLRGVRESARVFAVPTYFFIACMLTLIGVGLARVLTGSLQPMEALESMAVQGVQPLTSFLLLRAFTSGCTALTGVEAISDGVPVFKPPEGENAGKTLLWMIAILVTMFLGITFLAHQIGVIPREGETVVSQIARTVFGRNVFYYLIQAATMLILVLAANTSYADFPRLSMWMARDCFLPRQLANLGDRLVYANGIILLGLLSSLLVIIFHASTHALIPLYAVGVFTSFTLNQSGMVRYWLRRRSPGWQTSIIFNALGAVATGIVAVMMAATKFVHGAWIVLALIPLLVMMFRAIHHHYEEVAEQLSLSLRWPVPVKKHTVIVPVAGLHRGVVKAVYYAKALGSDLHVVTVDVNPEETAKLLERWKHYLPDIPLEVLPSPYRSVVDPLMEYVNSFIDEEGHYVTIVLPEFVPARWWHFFLHNQTALVLKWALNYARRETLQGRFRIITDVPFYLRH